MHTSYRDCSSGLIMSQRSPADPGITLFRGQHPILSPEGDGHRSVHFPTLPRIKQVLLSFLLFSPFSHAWEVLKAYNRRTDPCVQDVKDISSLTPATFQDLIAHASLVPSQSTPARLSLAPFVRAPSEKCARHWDVPLGSVKRVLSLLSHVAASRPPRHLIGLTRGSARKAYCERVALLLGTQL